jgi:hypothetical protein
MVSRPSAPGSAPVRARVTTPPSGTSSTPTSSVDTPDDVAERTTRSGTSPSPLAWVLPVAQASATRRFLGWVVPECLSGRSEDCKPERDGRWCEGFAEASDLGKFPGGWGDLHRSGVRASRRVGPSPTRRPSEPGLGEASRACCDSLLQRPKGRGRNNASPLGDCLARSGGPAGPKTESPPTATGLIPRPQRARASPIESPSSLPESNRASLGFVSSHIAAGRVPVGPKRTGARPRSGRIAAARVGGAATQSSRPCTWGSTEALLPVVARRCRSARVCSRRDTRCDPCLPTCCPPGPETLRPRSRHRRPTQVTVRPGGWWSMTARWLAG